MATDDPAIRDRIAAVGGRIRSIRDLQRISLRALAARTGVSPSTISRLETGGRRVTLDLLLRLAPGLGVSLDELLQPPAATRLGRRGAGPSESMVPLTRHLGDVRAFKQVLAPDHPDRGLQLGTHEGYEWMFVLSGRVRLHLADEVVDVGPGEIAEFDTRVPHAVRNPGPERAELINLFGPQGERAHVRVRTTHRGGAGAD